MSVELTAASPPLAAGPAVVEVPRDRAGQVEEQGVDYIPEAGRTSRPANLIAVFLGGNLALSVMVFGWLPVTFGLGWWSTVTSCVAGIALGTLVTVPLALLGPRTGTNNPVASGAHFGINGRLIGSVITLLFALAYAAISVWTGGDAIVAAAARLLGTPDGDGALAVGYALIAGGMVVVALYGHATLVLLQKVLVPVVGVLMLLGVAAFAGSFEARGGGEYVLGGFWQTWALSVVVAAAGPISYAASLGDYTRRISHRRHGDRAVLAGAAAGLFGGLLLATLFGAFTAFAFTGIGDSYVLDLVGQAPGWYVLPVLLIGLAGSMGQGAINMYATGLDMESLIPRLRRMHTTLITSVVAIALVFAGTFVLAAVDSITAMTLVLNGLAAPWVAVNLVGFFLARRRRYDPEDLQDFARGRRGGRYWFTAGWNPRAVAAWAAGSAFGLLSVNTTLYVGPLADVADGIDVSMLGSGAIAAAAYALALAVWPERVPEPAA